MKRYRILSIMHNYIFWLSVFIFINLSTSEVHAQWKVINPKPFVDNCFIINADSNLLSVLTSTGNMILSSDGGISWNYKFTDKAIKISTLFMIDRNNGWAIENLLTFKTTNGGYTWEDKGNVLQFANWDIYFKDLLNGWSVGNGFVKYTSNGGDTWATDTVFTNAQLQFITQYNDSVFFTGGINSFFRSNDGGFTWNAISGPNGSNSFEKFITVKDDSQ